MISFDKMIAEIKRVIKENAPDAEIILFGSRARGDARPDSDWDILILVDKEKINPGDYDKIAFPLFDLGGELDTYISPKIYTKNDWVKRSFTPFYKNVEADGIVL
jgi:predicted nucleotidyltransferase